MNALEAQDRALRRPLELGSTLRALLQPWRELHLWPPLSWLMPVPRVRLLQADGGESLWVGEERVPGTAAAVRSAPFTAVELPQSLCLECRLALPALRGGELRDAVALEVRSASPFEPADLVWGYRTRAGRGGALDAVAVLASRRSVERHLGALGERLAGAAAPEVWVLDDQGRAIVVEGYGEPARQQRGARGRLLAYLLLATALVLTAALAVTPTLKLKLRAMQAATAYEEAERQMAPLLAQREQLVRTQGEIVALREAMAGHVEPLAVVDLLTRLIPDDTWLQRMQVQGNKVTVNGQTPNAAALMNTLSSHPGVRDVRAPSAATRAMSGGRENFTVEWTMTPDLLRPSVVAAQGGVRP